MEAYYEAPLRLAKYNQENLRKKIAVMPEGGNEYEKVCAIDEKIILAGRVKALSAEILKREEHYINYWHKMLIPSFEDMDANYDAAIKQAHADNRVEVKSLLSKIEFNPIGGYNFEGKLMMYRELKALLENGK